MGASHYVTFHVTSGRCLLMNSPLSFKLQVLPPPQIPPSTEMPDIKQPFLAALFRGKASAKGTVFSLNNFLLLCYCSWCFKMLVLLINAISLCLFFPALLLKGPVLEI